MPDETVDGGGEAVSPHQYPVLDAGGAMSRGAFESFLELVAEAARDVPASYFADQTVRRLALDVAQELLHRLRLAVDQ